MNMFAKGRLPEPRGTGPSARIIQLLREEGVASQAEIARRTGLGKSTVSRVIAELQRNGVVVEAGRSIAPAGGASGRPAAALTLNPENGICVGLQLGLTSIRAVVADISHAILSTRVAPLPLDYSPIDGLETSRRLMEEALAVADVSPDRLIGVGIAVPSPVHPSTGQIIRSSIIGTWGGIEITKLFEPTLERPIVVDNESNCAALAELTWGAARGYADVLYYKIEGGVGGAVICNGRLVRGVAGGAGEFGHVVHDPAGPICRCGNRGCVELYLAVPALLELLRPTYGSDMTAQRMIALAAGGDAGCRRVIADAAEIAGRSIAGACNMFNPELIVVDGALAAAGELLLTPLRHALARHVLIAFDEDAPDTNTRLSLGTLGEDASALGAMGLALRQIADPAQRR